MPFPSGTLFPSGKLFPGEGTPPDAIILSGPPTSRSRTAKFLFTANPLSEDTVFEYRLNGGPWGEAISPFEITDLPFGIYKFELRATDNAGTDPEPASWVWRVLGERALTARADEMLRELPGWAQSAPEHKAVCVAYANEGQRQEAMAREVRDGLIPQRANALTLPLWETMLKLTVSPSGQTVEERRATVNARLEQAAADPSGVSWEVRITRFLGPTWTYKEEEPQTIRATVPWQPGSAEFQFAKRLFRREIPAAWELILQSEEGFILDLSELDNEAFHAE